MDTVPRPKSRPELELTYDDLYNIERVVWAEARGEDVQGRDAVRGVIFNRLMSDRFPDTIEEVLSPDQFEPVRKYGTLSDIPVPQEDLEGQFSEMVDYIQIGKDAVDGRTFFQNAETTKRRGTSFDGPDPILIGNHTFTRGYEGQEPVNDTNFSHNIAVIDPEYDVASEEGFARGGLALSDATKGITTQEGKDMADKKFQRDDSKADIDNDGKLTEYEKVRGDAVQKAMADDPEQDEKYGLNCGGMMAPEEDYDPVSGNAIPIGSTAKNVRDDIEVYVSEGEYVLPADVVKWHGLKHIMDMQDEAKMGLMGMYAEGLIQEVAEEATECPNCMGEGCEYCEAEVAETEDEDVPSEDVDVEVASVEVDDMMDEEEDTEEVYPEESVLPAMMQKQKFAFIV